MIKFKRAAYLSLCLLSLSAYADSPAPYEPALTVLRGEIQYEVHEDGTYVRDEALSIHINNEMGLKQAGQIPLPYSTSLQTLEVLEAYTTTRDGKRVDVASDKIFAQQSPFSERAPMFSDIKVKAVVFPALEVGATVYLHFQRTQTKPQFPGAFSMIEKFDKTQEIKSAKITVVAPETLPLYLDAVDIAGGEIVSTLPHKKMWRWSLENSSAHLPEPGSVGPADFSPRIALTSFANYGEVSKSYLAQAEQKARVTPEVQKLADDITRGIKDKRAQAEAVYNWVSTNIRYVAIFLELGGVVPHDAEAILAAKYGDCKDHVVLLQALLAAKQIKSNPVLVNGTNEYWLPKVAVAPGEFNHVISYLPDFDIYLDSTAQFASFGVLSPAEIGKSALLTDISADRAKIVVLPEVQGGLKNAEYASTQIEITDSGDVDGLRHVSGSGAPDFIARALLSKVPKGMGRQLASQSLSATGQQGTGDIKVGDANTPGKPFTYEYQFNLPGYAAHSGPGSLSTPVGLLSLGGVEALLRSMALEKRDLPFACIGGIREETSTIKLPASMKLVDLPKPVKIANAYGQYESSYVAEQQTITVKRALTLKLPGVCNSEDYANLRRMTAEIAQDLRAKISYQ